MLSTFRHGAELQSKSYADVYDRNGDFDNINMIIDLVLVLPPKSVSCETTFSHMKLVKTSRQTRRSSTALNNLLTVKLESPIFGKFDPDVAIDRWFVGSYCLTFFI